MRSATAPVFFLLVIAASAHAGVPPQPPQGVFVMTTSEGAAIWWSEVPAAAGESLHYNVYGLGEVATLLGSTPATEPFFLASGDHPQYGVSVVVNGRESALSLPCVMVDTLQDPPYVGVNFACNEPLPIVPHLVRTDVMRRVGA